MSVQGKDGLRLSYMFAVRDRRRSDYVGACHLREPAGVSGCPSEVRSRHLEITFLVS